MKQLIKDLVVIREIGCQITDLRAKSKGLRADVLVACGKAGLKPQADGKYVFLIGHTLWEVSKAQDEKEVTVLYQDLAVLKELPVDEENSNGNA